MQQGDSGISEGTEVGSSGAVKCEEGDPVVNFPLEHLTRLDEQLGRPKWVVPVRQDDDLERLLRASIRLCKEGNFQHTCSCIHIGFWHCNYPNSH